MEMTKGKWGVSGLGPQKGQWSSQLLSLAPHDTGVELVVVDVP